MSENTERRYLKWYNKVGYGSGDVAGNVVYNPPNISEQRTAVRHHYSLFIVIYFLSQSAKSRARCGVCTGSCLISFTHC